MPAKQHDFTKTEIKAGVFVLVSVALFAGFVGAILKWRPPAESKTYYAYFTNTSGLKVGGDVRFGGVKSGRVSAIEPAPGRQSKIRVTAELNPDMPVNTESTAFVTQISLTSDHHLEISTGIDTAALLESGADIRSGAGGLFGQIEVLAENVNRLLGDVAALIGVTDNDGQPAMSDEEQQTIAELFVVVESLMADMQVLVGVTDAEGNPVSGDGEAVITVAAILSDLDATVTGGGDLVQDLRDIVDDVKPGVENILEVAEGVLTEAREVAVSAENLVNNVNSVVTDNRETIDDSLDSLHTALGAVEELVVGLNELVGTLDALIVENRPGLDDILINLKGTMQNLEQLTKTLSEQPQSIIRGRTPVGRQ